jgi:DNA-binding NarL/FixJ family response regulator
MTAAKIDKRSRLVIADDDPVVLAVLIAQLKETFEVVGTADSGEGAIQLVGRQRPDAALLDLEMPGGGGLHATRGIRDVSPETAVVILSIDEASDSVLQLLKAGAMTYLRKGIPPQALIERLQQSIHAHGNVELDRGGLDERAGTDDRDGSVR